MGDGFAVYVMAEIDDPRHLRLIEWMLDERSGCQEPKTRKALAEEMGVNPRTIWEWSRRPDVDQRFRELLMQNAGAPERFAQLVDAMFVQALDEGSGKQIQAANWIKDTFGLAERAKADVKTSQQQRDELMGLSPEELDRLLAQQSVSSETPQKAFSASDLPFGSSGTGGDVFDAHSAL